MKRTLAIGLALALAGCGSARSTARLDSSGDETLRFEDEEAALHGPPASDEVLAAEAELAEGRPRTAREQLVGIVERTPDDIRAWLDLALAHEMLETYDEAEAAYRRCLAIDPEFAEALNNLGALLRDTERTDEGIAVLRDAIRVRPAFASAHLNLALALEDAGDVDGAVAEYERVIHLAPTEPVSRTNLALIYLDRGNASQALIELRRALPNADGRADLATIGAALRRAGDPAMAIRALTDAIEAEDSPPPSEVRAELALAHFAADHRPEAEALLRAIIVEDDSFPTAHYLLANMLAAREAWVDAGDEYEAFLSAAPGAPEASEARGRLAFVRARAH